MKFSGRINVGLSKSSGNTETESHHVDGENVARTQKNSYIAGIEYNRKESDDLFIRSRTGFRFPLSPAFQATLQYDYDWDNTPAPGEEKDDSRYLFTLGYVFNYVQYVEKSYHDNNNHLPAQPVIVSGAADQANTSFMACVRS